MIFKTTAEIKHLVLLQLYLVKKLVLLVELFLFGIQVEGKL